VKNPKKMSLKIIFFKASDVDERKGRLARLRDAGIG
jgi:hypothetical protein